MAWMFDIGCWSFVFMLLNIKFAGCITCLNCRNTADLSNCKEAVVCNNNETCYIEKSLSPVDLQPVYNTGCKNLEYCRLEYCNKIAYGGNIQRKRQAIDDLTLCSECCYEDGCNTEGCGYIKQFNFTCPTGLVKDTSTKEMMTTPTTTMLSITTTRLPTTTAATTITTTTIRTSSTKSQPIITVKATLGPRSLCTFEQSNVCVWSQDLSDVFNWTIQSGPTLSSDTGPPVDHTQGNVQGSYAYIESSAPRVQGEIARLKSPQISSKTTICLSLWYYMYGDGIGDLTILLKKTSGIQSETGLSSITGEQGQQWKTTQVEIPASSPPYNYTLVIEGTIGDTYRGDIAIDDVLINDKSCTGQHVKPDLSGIIIG
ncbi:MAM and LDL-receptor class A domain-containing protein 1-like [Ruditapes philippinarum]|uniref:MAM and LDL-receptor class A domain-containing protein 1-like n=1 Tax=Ruditapes philippinarum TaxID=129788 RepID=UPI00295A7C59|nr:MAM and LDL-receptor class A domain-containing protein 1-like [Ruditapes philippinarum]